MATKNIPVGLDMLHYAIMDEADETYEEPVHVPGLIQATITPTTNSATLYADDAAYDVATSLGDIALALNIADLPTEDQAALLGHTVDTNGVLIRSSEDVAPYVALGFRRRLASGKYRYVWLYKGKFTPETQDAQTRGETPTFQPASMSATFVPRDKDKQWQAMANEGDTGFTNTIRDAWFDAVYEKASA